MLGIQFRGYSGPFQHLLEQGRIHEMRDHLRNDPAAQCHLIAWNLEDGMQGIVGRFSNPPARFHQLATSASCGYRYQRLRQACLAFLHR